MITLQRLSKVPSSKKRCEVDDRRVVAKIVKRKTKMEEKMDTGLEQTEANRTTNKGWYARKEKHEEMTFILIVLSRRHLSVDGNTQDFLWCLPAWKRIEYGECLNLHDYHGERKAQQRFQAEAPRAF